MKLVVGLGNIGQKYNLTRHNIGFMVIDELLNQISYTKISKASFKGELFKTSKYLLLKPSTFMNLSGESILAVTNYYKIDIDDIIVIHDDLDLNFGALKIKSGGGNGGHNGLKSIDSLLGKNYIRVRLGIDKPKNKDISNYVLDNFSKDEQKKLNEIILYSIDAIETLLSSDLNIAKSKFNRKTI